MDNSGSKKNAVAMTTISECLGELQSALAILESPGANYGSSSSGQESVHPHDKFSASRSLFYGLVRLNVLIGRSPKEELLPVESLCVQVLTTILQAKRLMLSSAFRHALCDLYGSLLNRSTTINLYMVLKDMQGILMLSKTVPTLSRVAALEILARVFRMRSKQLRPGVIADCLVVIIKQLKSTDLGLRQAALATMGAGAVASKAEMFKALKSAFADKTPEIRGSIALCLTELVSGVDDFNAVPLDGILTLCLKGLEDPSVKVQLLYAEAMASFLSLSVASHALESKVKNIKAARGEVDEGDGDKEGPSSGPSGVDKAVAKLKEIGSTGIKRSSAPSSYTFEGAIQYLMSLFIKCPGGAPFSQGSISAVLVAFLRRQREKAPGNLPEETMQWLLTVLLGLANRPGSQPNSREEIVTRTCISHILRAGLCAGAPEAVQLSLARYLVKLLAQDSNLNSHQLQLVLAELSNLIRTLQEASAVLLEVLLPRLNELLRHLSYGVRFEAAVTMESLCHALPHLSSSLLQQTIAAIRAQYEALALLSSANNASTIVANNSRSETPPVDGPMEEEENTADACITRKSSKNIEVERRYRICALHGNSNALVMLLKGLKALGTGVPPLLLEDAMAVAKQLVNQQFSPQMRKWATCVRAGWSILSAILYQGSKWAVKYVRVLFQLFGRSMELEANRHASEAGEPSNLLESMLGTVLVFVRECPQVLWTTPGALTATVELLDKNLEIVHSRFLTNRSAGSQLRLALVKAMLMEAYAWLPPGSYPTSSETLFYWSASQMVDLIGQGLSGSSSSSSVGSSVSVGGGLPGSSNSSTGTENMIENSMLSELVREEDSLLDYKSTYRGSLTGNLEVDVTPDILAMQVHLSGIPLEDREKDSAVSSGSVGASKQAVSQSSYDEPPTPLHANYWIRPPMPHPSTRVRLLDAAMCIFSATFGHQSNDAQTQAVEKLCSLLPTSLRVEGGQSQSMGVISVLTSDEEKRRKEERYALVTKNVTTAFLAALRGLPAHTDSRINVEVIWVGKMREALLGILGSPHSLTRRAACECLALLGQKMAGGMSIETTVQSLVELALRKEAPTASTMLKGPTSSITVTNRAAGATFALACLRRTLGAQIRLGSCWTAVQRVMVADVAQPLRTWGLHSLLLLLKSMSIGQNFGVMTNDTLQTLETIMEILEAHFLGVWSAGQVGNGGGSEYEPGLLVCLVRLMNALLPMVVDLQPNFPSVEKFKAIWEVIRKYDDTRVALECLQFVELLALFSPRDVVQSSALDLLRQAFKRSHKSQRCISTALSCLRSLAKRDGSLFRAHQLDLGLFALYESIASALHWNQAPFWRFVAVPRDLAKCYYGNGVLLDEIRATIDVMVASDSKEALHYILLSRAVILGASQFRSKGPPTTAAAIPRREIEDDEAGPEAAQRDDGLDKAQDKERLPDKLRREAAELAAPLPASRWQVKVVAIECTIQAFRLINEAAQASGEPLDLKKARQLLGKMGDDGRSAVLSSTQIICLFLEDVMAVACSTASATVDEQALPALQLMGVMLLRATVVLFSHVDDPDILSGAGKGMSVLQQYTSQMTSALSPSLTCAFSPQLVERACDVVLTAVKSGLVDDPIVVRRLFNQLLPPNLDVEGVMLPKKLSDEVPINTALQVHNVRLHAVADLYILVNVSREESREDAALRSIWNKVEGALWSPSVKEEVLDALERILSRHAEALRAHWLGMVKDGIRLQQGKDSPWPILTDKAIRLGGSTYDDSCDLSQITDYYIKSWPVMLAAVSSLANGGSELPIEEDVCTFLLAVVDIAIQSSTDARGGGGVLSATQAGQTQKLSKSLSSSGRGEVDDHLSALYYLIALDALLRDPYLHSGVDGTSKLDSRQATRLLRALAHGPFLRPDSSLELQAVAVRVVSHLLRSDEKHPGVIRMILMAPAKPQADPVADSTGSDVSGRGDDEDEEEGATAESLWSAVLEVVMVPLRRALPGLFAGPGGEVPGSFGVEVEEDETDEATTLSVALSSPLFQSCMSLLSYLPALCPEEAVPVIAPSMMAVALRGIYLASNHALTDELFQSVTSKAVATLLAMADALGSNGVGEVSRDAFISKALDYLLSFMDQEARTGVDDRVSQLMDAWLALHSRAKGGDDNGNSSNTVDESVAGLKAVSDSFFRCYPLSSRKALLLAARQAIQSHHHLSQTLLHIFCPLALVALHLPPSAADDTSLIQQYYSEAVKLILLAFTSLGTFEGGADVDVAALQSQHLSISLPALVHFVTETLKPMDPAAPLLRTLVSQALLSVARAAPQPFKEQVQALSPDVRATLEATLRASMTSGSGTNSHGSGGSKALKIDMSQYQS